MSSDSRRGSGGQHVSDAHTDPLLPRITDEMVASGGPPAPAPALDDRTLAELISELEGDDQYALDELLAEDEKPPPPAPRAEAAGPVAEPEQAQPEPLESEPAVAVEPPEPEQVTPPPAQPIPPSSVAPVPSPRATCPEPVAPPAPPMQRTAPSTEYARPDQPARGRDDFLDEDDSHPVIRQSPLGPVVRSRYGDFRPPVEREAEAQTLTGFGLTRRSRSKLGSRLFTVVFVAIFLLILIQAVASLFTAGH